MNLFQEELYRLVQECKKESNAFTSSEEDSGNEVDKIIKFSQKWDFKEKHDKLFNELSSLNEKVNRELKIANEKIGRNFFKELIPIMDELFTLSKIISSDPLIDRGIKIILVNIERLLERKNGYIIKPKFGEEMNPAFHKVIMAEEVVGHSGNTVSEVYRYGYVVLGQVLREAEIKVKCGVLKK